MLFQSCMTFNEMLGTMTASLSLYGKKDAMEVDGD